MLSQIGGFRCESLDAPFGVTWITLKSQLTMLTKCSKATLNSPKYWLCWTFHLIRRKQFFGPHSQEKDKRLEKPSPQWFFWTRDLGGHVQYSQLLTNSIVTGKISSFQPRWKVLAVSKASYRRKLHAIKALAWPNMLHEIASALVGANHYDDLPTAALRALGGHRPGMSPVLHLSMISHPAADPGF